MSNENGRIPRDDGKFNSYINTATDYLNAPSPAPPGAVVAAAGGSGSSPATATAPAALVLNWQRLGLLQAEMDSWNNQRRQWNTTYAKYGNLDMRTRTTTADKNTIKKTFITFAQPLLSRMAFSPNITTADREALNLKARDTKPTRHRTPLKAQVEFVMLAQGGGEIKFSCRNAEDGSRASITKGATGVELRYKVGAPAPENFSECPFSFISTKAIFLLNLNPADEGKKLYVFARWIVGSDPNRNGPWSGMNSVVVA